MKICPETNEKVIYLDCLECETKKCRQNSKDQDLKASEKTSK